MEKYHVELSIQAKNDYKKIISYLKNNLSEPSIASKYLELINNELQTLAYLPYKHSIIDDDMLKNLKYRKLIIKNYIAFYRINEEEKIVEIHRILYGSSNWIYEL